MAANSPRSIVVAIPTAGALVQGPGVDGHLFTVTGHASNAGIGYVGDRSSVVLNGYPLKTSGNQIVLQVEKNLSEL